MSTLIDLVCSNSCCCIALEVICYKLNAYSNWYFVFVFILVKIKNVYCTPLYIILIHMLLHQISVEKEKHRMLVSCCAWHMQLKALLVNNKVRKISLFYLKIICCYFLKDSFSLSSFCFNLKIKETTAINSILIRNIIFAMFLKIVCKSNKYNILNW